MNAARIVALAAPTHEQFLALHDEFGQIEPVEANVFADILDGSGRYPRRPHPRAALAPPHRIDATLAGLRRPSDAIAATLPSHVDLLDVIHPARP